MAYRRTRSRRAPRRRVRLYRRKTITRRRMNTRRKSNQHFFKRSFTSSITILKSGNTSGCNVFTLNQLPNYTEFSNLFDQYRVNGVKYEFIPRFNSIDQAAATGGEFYTAIDRTDNDAPASLNDMLEYQSLRKTPLTRRHVRYYKPGVPTAVYMSVDDPNNSVAALSSAPKLSPWLSTDATGPSSTTSLGIEHLGLKYWCSQTNAAANTTMDVICTAYLQFRTVK